MGAQNYLKSLSNASAALRSRGLTSCVKYGGYKNSFASSYNKPSESRQSASRLGDYLSSRRFMDDKVPTEINNFLNRLRSPGTSGFLNRTHGISGDGPNSQQVSERPFDRLWREAEAKKAAYPDSTEPASSTTSRSPSSDDTIYQNSFEAYQEPPLSEEEQSMWDNAIKLAKEDVRRGKYSKVIDDLNISQSDNSQSVSTDLPASFTSQANSSESYQESPLSKDEQDMWDYAIEQAKEDVKRGKYSKVIDDLDIRRSNDFQSDSTGLPGSSNSEAHSSDAYTEPPLSEEDQFFYDKAKRLAQKDLQEGKYLKIIDGLGLYSNSDESKPRSSVISNNTASASDTNLDRYDSDADNASVYSAKTSTCQRCGGSRISSVSPRKRRGKARRVKKGRRGTRFKKRPTQRFNYTSSNVGDSSYVRSDYDEFVAETARMEAQNARDLADALYQSKKLAWEIEKFSRDIDRLSSRLDSAY